MTLFVYILFMSCLFILRELQGRGKWFYQKILLRLTIPKIHITIVNFTKVATTYDLTNSTHIPGCVTIWGIILKKILFFLERCLKLAEVYISFTIINMNICFWSNFFVFHLNEFSFYVVIDTFFLVHIWMISSDSVDFNLF